MIPLSTRMRPSKLEDFVGQDHFMYPGSLFYNSIKNKTFDSAIFFGPSGTGKTTLARIIAREMDGEFHEINASVTGTKELKELLDNARVKFFGLEKKTTYVYIDEFHRWNKLQQDSLLKALEEGVIKFIGSTTENPYFAVNNAIISRVRNIYEFKRLTTDNLRTIAKRALDDKEIGFGNLNIKYDEDAINVLVNLANGDARVTLDTIGFIVDNLNEGQTLTKEIVSEAMQRKIGFYDKGDDRYNLLSALQKSIRGSDPDAAIHYFARLMDGGADIQMVGRRLMVIASEDIGMAYPSAISIVTSCVQAALMVGLPEAVINLSQAVILLAAAPKSNSAITAYEEAINDLHSKKTDDVPPHLKDSHYKGAKDLGYGKTYKYPHAYGGYVEQQYLPNNLFAEGVKYYHPTENGSEGSFKKFWKVWKQNMREIVRANNSGFCFGVTRALDKTNEQIEICKGKKLYTCGPLIHNRLVTDDLAKRGVKIIYGLDEVEEGATVIVRSHGETAAFFKEAELKNINVVDATCPFVNKIHMLVKGASEKGYQVVIVGDKMHPEVIGISGWCENAIIVNSVEEAELIEADNLFVVAQTTLKKETFDEIINCLKNMQKSISVNNTICNATTERQNGCITAAKNCEAMVIVGGKNSSNTRKLFEISKKYCKNSYFVEKIEDLPLQQLLKCNKIGVAAGASTPECVIKEVIATMSENITEMNMQDLMEDIEKSLRLPRVGETVNGKVHQVTEKEIIVNMGCKKDGIIPKEEVTLEGDQKLTDLFNEGDEIQAKVIKTDDGDGGILLSKKKLEVNEHWTEIIEASENKSIINVKVVKQVNGGVIAAYKEVSGFIPMSQISDKYIENADEFIGKELAVRITRVDQKRGRAVFSHKVVLAEEKQKKLDEVWNSLNVDDVVEGTVMRFTDYGAFVDLGGIDGLLHISEISWGKLKHPQEVLQIGDTVKVKILSMNAEKGKISLGLKQTQPEPWSVINEKYEIGQVVEGKVVQIKEYGAFVELEPGLDGLVHISEVANKRVTNIAEELEVGQAVNAKILEIDTERKRISLSIKQTLEEVAYDEADDAVEE